jgi:type III restriction enzyme
MILKEYQATAVENVSNAIKRLLNNRELRKVKGEKDVPVARVVLKSPTGSGKTMMAAEILRSLEDYFEDKPFAFIWAAPNKLHLQSHKKLIDELADTRYKLVDVEDVPQGALEDDVVLFTNWEKIFKRDKDGEWGNKAVRKGEDERNLQDVMDATRSAGIGMLLIVDESHQTFYGPNSQALVSEVIKPDLVLEVSATPKMALNVGLFDSNLMHNEIVELSDVIDSGLIKKEVVVNKNIEEYVEERSAIEAAVTGALEKREFLKSEYEKLGKNINPLVLIQLPNSQKETMSDLDEKDLEIIEDILIKKGYSYNNGNLAIWLSSDKKNLENIEKNDNQVEVLIFKQAIALGWDCPRAQILVMLRDVKSETFKIQTVGRILRMPEAKHYGDSDLDAAYVYTDLSKIEIDKEDKDGPNLIKFQHAKREEGRNISLPDSIYLHRVDYGDLRADFKPVLENVLNQTFDVENVENMSDFRDKIDEKLEIYPEELKTPIISNEVIENLDEYSKEEVETLDIKMDQTSVERVFNITLRGYTGRFKNFARSRGIICGTLYSWFAKAGIYQNEVESIIACSADNQRIFKQIFDYAIDQYDTLAGDEMRKRRAREIKDFDFEIPKEDNFSEKYTVVGGVKKHALLPYYRKNNAPKTTEIPFEVELEKSSNVEFWYKNGEKMDKYFAVEYSYMDEFAKTHRGAFYPDYLVKFTDGSVGIYDTKAGRTAENKATAQKANALQKYITDHSKLNLKGGIIDVRSGDFYIQDDSDYDYDDATKWKRFYL